MLQAPCARCCRALLRSSFLNLILFHASC
jgi:hypothetical protein